MTSRQQRRVTGSRPGWMDLIDRVLLRGSVSRYSDGLWIGAEDKEQSDLILGRVEKALGVIKLHDPRRYCRILRDVDRVWVRALVGVSGRWVKSLRACQLDRRFILDDRSSPELGAAIIVHEATHARLMHCGIGYEEEVRGRVEKVCIRRELAFAARLPNGGEVRRLAEKKLTLPAESWSDEALRERWIDDLAAALRALAAPDWVARALLRLNLMYQFAIKGRAHPDAARALDYLARVQQAQGDLAPAQRGLEGALAIREKALGPNHPDTARNLRNLGRLMQARSKFADARIMLERALAIREKEFGANHPETAASLDDLCELRYRQNDLEGAQPLFERAVATGERAFGPDQRREASTTWPWCWNRTTRRKHSGCTSARWPSTSA